MNKELQKNGVFCARINAPILKQKAHQRQIEHPGGTWQDLQDYVINRDLSYTVSSEYACAGSSNFDNQSEIQALKNQLTELTNLMKENKINATYDPNQPRNRQNHTRFCSYCKRSGHTIAYCFEKKRHDEQNRQPPSYRDKFTDNYRRSPSNEYNRQNTPQQNSRGRARDFISSNNKNNYYNNSPKFYHNPARSPSNYSMQRYPDSYNQNRVAQNADTRSRSLNLKTALMKIIEIIVGKDTDLSITEYKILRILDKIPTTLEVQVGTEKLFSSHQSLHKFRTQAGMSSI